MYFKPVKTQSEKLKRELVVRSTSCSFTGLKFSSIRLLTTTCNFSSSRSDALFWHLLVPALTYIYTSLRTNPKEDSIEHLNSQFPYLRNYFRIILYKFPTEAQEVKEMMVSQKFFRNSLTRKAFPQAFKSLNSSIVKYKIKNEKIKTLSFSK